MRTQKYDIRIDLKESSAPGWRMIAFISSRNLYWNNGLLKGLLSLQGFGNNVYIDIVDIDMDNDEDSGEVTYGTYGINGKGSMIRVTYRKIKE